MHPRRAHQHQPAAAASSSAASNRAGGRMSMGAPVSSATRSQPAAAASAAAAASSQPAPSAAAAPMSRETPAQQLQRLKQELAQLKHAEADLDRHNASMIQERDELRSSVLALRVEVAERECEARALGALRPLPPAGPPDPQLQFQRSEEGCRLRVQEAVSNMEESVLADQQRVVAAAARAFAVIDPQRPENVALREQARARADQLRAQTARKRQRIEEIKREIEEKEAEVQREVARLPELIRLRDQRRAELKAALESKAAADRHAAEMEQLAAECRLMQRDPNHQPSEAMKRTPEYKQWLIYEDRSPESLAKWSTPQGQAQLASELSLMKARLVQVRALRRQREQEKKQEQHQQQQQQQVQQLQQQLLQSQAPTQLQQQQSFQREKQQPSEEKQPHSQSAGSSLPSWQPAPVFRSAAATSHSAAATPSTETRPAVASTSSGITSAPQFALGQQPRGPHISSAPTFSLPAQQRSFHLPAHHASSVVGRTGAVGAFGQPLSHAQPAQNQMRGARQQTATQAGPHAPARPAQHSYLSSFGQHPRQTQPPPQQQQQQPHP